MSKRHKNERIFGARREVAAVEHPKDDELVIDESPVAERVEPEPSPEPAYEPEPVAEQPAPVEPEKVVEPKDPVYRVARGRCVTSRKGLLEAGDEVTASILGCEPKRLDELVESGALTKS